MNQFPVRGRNARTPEELIHEEPLLLNPYSDDDPRRHLRFFTGLDGELWGDVEGVTEEGRATVGVCNLNREELVFRRRRAQELIILRLNRLIDRWGDAVTDSMIGQASPDHVVQAKQKIFDELVRLRNGDGEFSASVLAAAEQLIEQRLSGR